MQSTPKALTIAELIDNRGLGRFQAFTIALCAIVLVLDGFATQSIGFLAPSMAQSLRIPVHSFGPVFGSALFGLMVSSLLAGPLADRVGRKGPVVAATLIFGVFTIATPLATTLKTLILLRFLTGLGLGAAIPNVVALVAEYSPRRLQQIVVTAIFCGMPMGALLGGLMSAVVLPRWGWRSVFYAGGGLTLLFALLLIAALPESLRFLISRGSSPERLSAILSRLAPDNPSLPLTAPVSTQARSRRFPVIDLFTQGRALGTLLLWVPFFMNLLLLYFIVNWLPALLRQTRMPPLAGILAVAIFSLGGILGSLIQGYAMRAFGARVVLLAEFLPCLGLVGCIAYIGSFPLLMAVTFLLGCLVQGAQAGINAVAATFYPTAIRSTGVGWALGIGRLGSILGPVFGGMMLSRGWTLHAILLTGSLPALAASVALIASFFSGPQVNPYRTT